jgi:uncharacterized cupredoxin-like copper-binding protein
MERVGLRRCASVLLTAALVLAGCGGDGDDAQPDQAQPSGDGHGHSHSAGPPTENFAFTLGKPGDEGAAARTVQIEAVRGFRYAPMKLEVAAGDTIKFEVTNEDVIPHELVLGNSAYQQLHQNQANAGGVYHDYSKYSVHVSPGDTLGFTWTFEEPGRVQYACHIQGHFEQGMIGEIRIT